MIIKTILRNPNGKILKIRLGNEVKTLSGVDDIQSFTIPGPGTYRIDVEEEPSINNYDKATILISIAVLPIYGLLNVIFQNAESQWIKYIRAYVLNAAIRIEVTEDAEIELEFTPAVYEADDERWAFPKLGVANGVVEDIVIQKNSWWEFRNCYVDYIRRGFSVVFLLLALLVVILVSTVSQGSLRGTTVCAFMLAALIILCTAVAITQYRKCKKLYNDLSDIKAEEFS